MYECLFKFGKNSVLGYEMSEYVPITVTFV